MHANIQRYVVSQCEKEENMRSNEKIILECWSEKGKTEVNKAQNCT